MLMLKNKTLCHSTKYPVKGNPNGYAPFGRLKIE